MRDDYGYAWFLGRVDKVIKISAYIIGTMKIEDDLLQYRGS